jgi:hypothetical protein
MSHAGDAASTLLNSARADHRIVFSRTHPAPDPGHVGDFGGVSNVAGFPAWDEGEGGLQEQLRA